MIAELNRWTQENRALYLATSLKGQARALLSDVDGVRRRNFTGLVTALKNRFGPANQTQLYWAWFKNKVRQPNENLAQDVQRLAMQVP
ncbi:hypothetical protein HOLleu_15592 [Holothuria leucospilota]|uniref:Uncharacterized protein n=1 Tax=Holothuria leucospilota TaxID=206669 RepID=A0A9Q1C3Z5_HOLLE|nr:hypothetical protein HOLleu_15592 [Holothuria leucospilota]